MIPDRFRQALGTNIVMVPGFDRCIMILSGPVWEGFAKSLKNLPVSDRKARSLTRYFFSNAVPVTLKEPHIITIPDHLKKMTNIQDECLFIGAGNRLELWEPEEYENATEPEAEEIPWDISI